MLEPVDISVKRLAHAGDLPLPSYETSGSAGMDVRAAENIVIAPGHRGLVGTGLAFAIPQGYEIQVRPRSGLALKKGIGIPNSPGTIDSDYRGELKIILLNHGEEDFIIERGERVVQRTLFLLRERLQLLPQRRRVRLALSPRFLRRVSESRSIQKYISSPVS